MGLHNFWNNFSYGFLNGMFNSNPFMCGFGYNSFSFSCWSNPFAFNIFQYPSSMNYPPMFPTMPVNPFPTLSMPRIDTTSIFPTDIWNTPKPQTNNHPWLDSFERTNITQQSSISEEKLEEKKEKTSVSTEKQSTNTVEELANNSRNEISVSSAKELYQKWKKINPDLKEDFYEKVIKISKNINCSPDDLLALMNSESGLDSKITNSIGAVGLIQFLPSTARDLGTTTETLKNMSPVEQLDYVEKYLLKMKKTSGYTRLDKLNSGTLYALTFLPAYAKQEVLSTTNDKYYKQNKGLDINNDGRITKTDLSRKLKQKMV